MKPKIDIYTDGSGHQQNACAWAAVIVNEHGVNTRCIVDGQLNGTSNIAEMKAVIAGLEYAFHNFPAYDVCIHTDSAYVMNAFTNDWMTNWRANGWKNSRGRKVKNKELWLTLAGFVASMNVAWTKVKSHSGNKWNDLADELCGLERKRWLDGSHTTTNVSNVN